MRGVRVPILSVVSMFTFAILALSLLVPSVLVPSASAQTTNYSFEQVQVPPPLHRVGPPSPLATAEELELTGDQLRTQKFFIDALDYYRTALGKKNNDGILCNKIGITELMMQHYREARKDFERAIKIRPNYADAYNNLGVVFYEYKNYGKAIKHYQRAIAMESDSASLYGNLGAAYFAKKDFAKSIQSYARALELDPGIFNRTSHGGAIAQLASPEDRAHYDYVLAKLFARMGVSDQSLEYLRKAMEEGFKEIKNVYKDEEFAQLRKDPRFTQLMGAQPVAIPD